MERPVAGDRAGLRRGHRRCRVDPRLRRDRRAHAARAGDLRTPVSVGRPAVAVRGRRRPDREGPSRLREDGAGLCRGPARARPRCRGALRMDPAPRRARVSRRARRRRARAFPLCAVDRGSPPRSPRHREAAEERRQRPAQAAPRLRRPAHARARPGDAACRRRPRCRRRAGQHRGPVPRPGRSRSGPGLHPAGDGCVPPQRQRGRGRAHAARPRQAGAGSRGHEDRHRRIRVGAGRAAGARQRAVPAARACRSCIGRARRE